MYDNVYGTSLLFDVIKKNQLKVKKIVVASSQAMYGEGNYLNRDGSIFQPKSYRDITKLKQQLFEVFCQDDDTIPAKPIPIPETANSCCSSAYAISKHTEERIALSFGKELGIPTVALRYAVTFGPRQSIFNPYTGVISIFSTLIQNGRGPIVYEDGLQSRDFIFVKDVARANIFVAISDEASYDVFNVSNCEGNTILNIATELCKLWGREDLSPELRSDFRPWDVRHLILDNTKLKKLGWSPMFTVREGLLQQVEWIKEEAKKRGTIAEYFSAAEAKLKKSGIIMTSK